jgi:inhibitor of cysteine peptidase
MKAPAPALELNEQDHRRNVESSVGQEIDVQLRENPSTGFRWRIDQPGKPVCSLLHEAFAPDGGKPGQPGVHVWRFKVVSEGAASIELAYCRSWESKVSAARTFSFHISAGAP